MDSRLGKSVRRSALALLVAWMGLAGNASAVLLDRGENMVYDTVLDITWTRQAGEGDLKTWADANSWAAGFSINDPTYGFIDDWRLPYASVSAGAGPTTTVTQGLPCTGAGGADEVACRDNELGYMFYYNLGGSAGDNKTGTQTAVGGEVLTGIRTFYWSGSWVDSEHAWALTFFGGGQGNVILEFSRASAWAVRPGDVAAAAVPAPGSLGLLGLGLLALGFARRRRQQ